MKKFVSRLSFLFLASLLVCFMVLPVFADDVTGSAASYSSGPVIIAQPSDQFVFVLSNAYFTVKASGSDLTYKWEYRKDNVNKYWSSAGSTTDTLVIEGKTYREGFQYRCAITDSNGLTVYTEPATLHVYEQNDLSSVATADILTNVFSDIMSVLPVLVLALIFYIGIRKAIQFVAHIIHSA